MSTLVFVVPEIFTQADGAQSSRVPIPLPEDPYKAIRQTYLNHHPHHYLRVLHPLWFPLGKAVRVPPAMSSGLSASMADVVAMSESAFHKRFKSSRESLSSLSPPNLPSQKRYRGTSELVEDSEDDNDEEDEEVEESLDSNSVSEDAEDEGPTAKDEDPIAGDEGLAAGDEGPSMRVESRDSDDESHGLDDEGHSVESDGLGLGEEEEVVPEGQQQAVPVVGTVVSMPLELGYGALRRQELALEEEHVYSTFEPERSERVSASRQPTLTPWTDPEDGMVYIDVPAYPPPAPPVQTPPLPEWTSGSLPISLSPFIVPSPISSPMIPLTSRCIGGLIRDHAVRLEELSPALFERSLKHEQERVAMTFGALWRPVLALESWAGQMDAQRAALCHAISDTQGENRELRL
ncbi:hypothetical protein Tco_0010474 [Tanacetum coccineum]